MPRSVSPFQIESLESRIFLSAAEVIRNGGFEGTVATTDWTRTGAFQADSRFTNFHSGAGYAYFSDTSGNAANNLTGTLTQTFTIPSTASSLTLSYWTKFTTAETTTTAKNDTMVVTATDGTTTQTVGDWSNLDASSAYVQRTFSLNRSFIGKSVTLSFSGATNASLATTFRVDDVSLNAVSPATTKRIVAYLPDYRYTSTFSKIDPKLITHVNYFSVSATTAGIINTPSSTFLSHLDTAVAAYHAAGVTVSITIGPASFSTVASTQAGRDAFAASATSFALAHNLDGIDIDWEPPAANNYADYGSLVADFYQETSPQHLLLTAAVNPLTNEIPKAAVNSYMDWINVMCYDFSYANHSTYTASVNGMLDWTNYGVSKNKLVMGLPFYGRQGTGWGAGQTTSSSYVTVLNQSMTDVGKYPAPDIDFYGFYYNGADTIKQKTQYVVDNSYGGMMIWELGQDWYTSSGKYDQRSLLPVIKNTLYGSPNIGTVTASLADKSIARTKVAKTFDITITGTATAAGVLNVSLVGTNATLSQDWFKINAPGAYSHTFTVTDTQQSPGMIGYEVYAQFRAGASTGPFTVVQGTDEAKLTLFHLNWQNWPAIPSNPTPADSLTPLVSAKPTLLNWDDSADTTSYDVYFDGVLKGNVTMSQWSTSGTTISPNVTHTWQIIAKNAYGTTTGPTWSFIYNDAPNTPTNSSPANNASNVAINPTLSASAFVDIDAGDTHAASQWLVRRVSDNALIYDSGTSTTSKTSIAISGLAYTTAYTWQVRYQDNHGAWSNYSTATRFSTPDKTPPTLANDAHDNDAQTISASASEAINATTGHAFIAIDGGAAVDIGSGSVNGLLVTYALPPSLVDGLYTLTIPAGSISDTAGNGLANDFITPFFIMSGDVNHNGLVDINDFNILATNFGKPNTPFSRGNLDRSADGVVSITDFNLLAAAFGKNAGRPSDQPATQSFSTQTIGSTTNTTTSATTQPPQDDLLKDVGLL